MSKPNDKETNDIFFMPISGYGKFQDYFDARYDEAEGVLLEQNPALVNDADARISGACEIAERQTLAHIKSLGIEIIYSNDLV